MEENVKVLVQVDKTVIKLTGLSVHGLNINELEELLKNKLKSMVRIIGVSGDRIEMDVYGVEEENILRNEQGIIQTVALARGITVSDITKMEHVKKIRTVDVKDIPAYDPTGCKAERWLNV